MLLSEIMRLRSYPLQRLPSLSRSYCCGSSDGKGFLLIYSITSRSSFERVPEFFHAITCDHKTNPIIVLVGNKVDEENNRQISRVEGIAQAKELGVPFIETSAKTLVNVDNVFCYVLRRIIDQEEGASSRVQDKKERGKTCIIA